MSRRKRKHRIPTGSDGSPIQMCPGCGFGLSSERKNQLCPRGCGMRVCRVCREDRPHATSGDGLQVCALPPGQQPKYWGLENPPRYPNPFPAAV